LSHPEVDCPTIFLIQLLNQAKRHILIRADKLHGNSSGTGFCNEESRQQLQRFIMNPEVFNQDGFVFKDSLLLQYAQIFHFPSEYDVLN
jgi:hypothetical protein